MASYEVRKDKGGNITGYRLIVSLGYDASGKKLFKKKSITKPDNIRTEKQIEKWLNDQAALFENAVKNNQYFDGDNLTFEVYAMRWFENIAKKEYSPTILPRTERQLTKRIIPALGYLKLTKLQTHHLDDFFNHLQGDDVRLDIYYIPNETVIARLQPLPMSSTCREIGVTFRTLQRIKSGEKTNLEVATKISNYLNIVLSKSFSTTSRVGQSGQLAGKTIKQHHEIIQAILSNAKREKLIQSNPLDDIRRLKRQKKKEIQYYDVEQLKAFLRALEFEPIKYKAIGLVAIDTGVRLSELAGLTWENVDLTNGVLRVVQQRQRVSKEYGGELIRAPKTENGIREISLSPTAVAILKEYQRRQKEDRLRVGDKWIDSEFVFRHEDGAPIAPGCPSQWLQRFLKKNNLPYLSFHGLRHTNASLLISAGEDVVTLSGRLGHADKNITIGTYSHILPSKEKQSANRMEMFYQESNDGDIERRQG